MDPEARQQLQNRILDLKVKHLNIRRKIYDIDQEIREKDKEIEALRNGGTRCIEAPVAVIIDRPENPKRKWSVEDEGFGSGSASDCEISAAKKPFWMSCPPPSYSTGPAIRAIPETHPSSLPFWMHRPPPPSYSTGPSTKVPLEIHSSPVPTMNVDSLLQNLLSSGVIHKPAPPVVPIRYIKPNLRNSKSLRARNPAVIAALYNGKMQKDDGCAESTDAKASTEYQSVADWIKG